MVGWLVGWLVGPRSLTPCPVTSYIAEVATIGHIDRLHFATHRAFCNTLKPGEIKMTGVNYGSVRYFNRSGEDYLTVLADIGEAWESRNYFRYTYWQETWSDLRRSFFKRNPHL
jgi:hypothetical protein